MAMTRRIGLALLTLRQTAIVNGSDFARLSDTFEPSIERKRGELGVAILALFECEDDRSERGADCVTRPTAH
jgi:hypothetical protein